MCRAQWVAALVALHVGLVHSRDIAVSLGDQLVFYTDGTITSTVNFISHNISALAYDEVHNRVLYVDKQSDNDSLCGYNLRSMENKCFIKRNGSNIHSIALDPATDTLFFTDTNERSLNWISLKPGSNNNVSGNLLIKLDEGTPTDIAVDSCRGYIYWTNTNTLIERYMEKARFDGTEREIKTDWLPLFSLAIDAQTRNIYYFDGYTSRTLKKGDLDEQRYFINLKKLISSEIYVSVPQALTVSKDYLYWMNGSESYTTVWHLPKNASKGDEPKEFSKFYNKRPLGIAANYKITDQIQGLQDCEALSSLTPTITVTNNSLNIQQTIKNQHSTETDYKTVVEPFCVHGIKVSDTSVCKCTPGYISERCDVFEVCENYCLQGDCSINRYGLPKCRCNAGYSGERCEVYSCHGYCLNNGVCSLNEKDEPVCQCVGNREGRRCEASEGATLAFTNTLPNYSAKRNRSLADIIPNWRKPTAKISFVVEVM